jgi:uncharacterized protein (TIGR01777 family)
MRIAITGSTGLVGTEIVRFFRSRGDHVTRIVRSYSGLPPNERAIVWNPREGTIEADGLRGHDVIIHLAGESIAGVWTPGRKRRIEASRVNGTTLLARTIAALPELPRVLLSASAMGFYGSRGGPVDETAGAGSGFLAGVARKWEESTAAAERSGVRVVHMRFGNVLSKDGGALAALLPVFKLGLGAKFGTGAQCWPWIALPEMGPAMLHLIEHEDIAGPVNFAAPEQTTNAQLTTTLAKAVGRPTLLTVPPFALRLAPGGMGEELLLGGACLVPRRLLETGYSFRYPSLAPALTALLHG